jgi:rubrerythrin
MLENLEEIREMGVRAFVRKEKSKWKCPACGHVLSVHRERCPGCGELWVESLREQGS